MTSRDLISLAPAALPVLGAFLVLLLDAFLPALRSRAGLLAGTAALALLGSLAALVVTLADGQPSAWFSDGAGSDLWYLGPDAAGLALLAVVGALVGLLLALPERRRPWARDPGVPLALLLVTTAGAVAACGAQDLVSLLVAVQLTALPAAALAGTARSERGLAAVVGSANAAAVGFAALALGAALRFAAAGSVHLAHGVGAGHRPLLTIGLALCVAGLAPLLVAVPGQESTTSAHLGAPAPVLVVLHVVPRVAALGALLALLGPDELRDSGPSVVLGAAALASLVLGNAMAMRQRQYVRLLGWLVLAQSGWVLLALAGGAGGVAAAAQVLLVGALATVLAVVALGGLALAEKRELRTLTLVDAPGLGRARPLVRLALSASALTLAGLPPLVIGLVGKVAALQAVLGEPGRWWWGTGAVVGYALGIAVTMRWMRFLWDLPGAYAARRAAGAATPGPVPHVHRGVIAVLVVALVVGSLGPDLLLRLVSGG